MEFVPPYYDQQGKQVLRRDNKVAIAGDGSDMKMLRSSKEISQP